MNYFVLILMMVFGCAQGFAAEKPAGLAIITEENPGSQIVSFQVMIRAGSLMNPAASPGLASFTARMILRGTQSRSFQTLSADIERLGASIDVNTDGTRTSYSGTVIAQNFEPLMEILREVFTKPKFAQAEISQLKAIITGELRASLQDPRTIASRAVMKQIYVGTPMEYPSDGTIASVAKLSTKQIKEFYRQYYVRENFIFAFSAPEDTDDLINRVNDYFGTLPSGQAQDIKVPKAKIEGRHAFIVDSKGMATIPLFLVIPGVADPDPDMPALELANFVFGADFTSRLTQVLRVQNGWTYNAGAYFTMLVRPKREQTVFSVYTFPSPEFAEAAIPKTFEMLEEFVTKGITPDEFKNARSANKNSAVFEVATAAQRLAQKVRETMTGRPYLSPEQYRKHLDSLDLKQVNAIVSKHLSTANLTIVTVGDAVKLTPIIKKLPGIESVDVVTVQP